MRDAAAKTTIESFRNTSVVAPGRLRFGLVRSDYMRVTEKRPAVNSTIALHRNRLRTARSAIRARQHEDRALDDAREVHPLLQVGVEARHDPVAPAIGACVSF